MGDFTLGRPLSDEGIVALSEIVCNLIPDAREATQKEMLALVYFLRAYWTNESHVADLVIRGLTVRRPKATLTGAIHLLRYDLLSEQEALELFRNLLKLEWQHFGGNEHYILTVGRILGIQEAPLIQSNWEAKLAQSTKTDVP